MCIIFIWLFSVILLPEPVVGAENNSHSKQTASYSNKQSSLIRSGKERVRGITTPSRTTTKYGYSAESASAYRHTGTKNFHAILASPSMTVIHSNEQIYRSRNYYESQHPKFDAHNTYVQTKKGKGGAYHSASPQTTGSGYNSATSVRTSQNRQISQNTDNGDDGYGRGMVQGIAGGAGFMRYGLLAGVGAGYLAGKGYDYFNSPADSKSNSNQTDSNSNHNRSNSLKPARDRESRRKTLKKK